MFFQIDTTTFGSPGRPLLFLKHKIRELFLNFVVAILRAVKTSLHSIFFKEILLKEITFHIGSLHGHWSLGQQID